MGGAVKKVREVAKTAKGATKKETRDSVQAAMKESLGKPDKLVGGVYVSQVTETDAELFLEEAAIDEVDSVMSSCVESGDKLANGYDATTALGACETKAKDAFKAFRGGEEAAIDAEITALNTAIASAFGADKIAKEAEKATKEQKKKLKAREIEYTYTKSKQDAGRKNALAGVKAKMADAKSKNKDIDAEITALDTVIAGMAEGTAKNAKVAEKATKAAKKIDMNTPAYKDEKRAMAKKAFKASMAVADILPVEMEKLLKETSKKEASDQLDAAFEIAQSATTDADIRTAFPGAGAKIDAYKTALDTANTKLDTANNALDTEIAAMSAGEEKTAKEAKKTANVAEKTANLAKKANVPAAELKKIKWRCAKDTAKAAAKDARMSKDGSTAETFEDSEFAAMMNDVAGDKAVATMAAAMRAKPDMTDREKLDTVKIEMKKSLASDEPIDDSTVKHFLKKGAIKKAREVAKLSATTTAADKRKSVQAAMKES